MEDIFPHSSQKPSAGSDDHASQWKSSTSSALFGMQSFKSPLHTKFNDPRQFVDYCFNVMYSMCQLNKTTLFGNARLEFKEIISASMIEALRQDPSLAGAEFETQQMVSKSMLHWACHFGLDLQLIKFICNLCPSSIFVRVACGSQRKEGLFPIDAALDNEDTSIATIRFLLENRSHYPAKTIRFLLTKVLTKFRLSDSVPLLERFFPDKSDQQDLTRSIQFEYGYNDNIAADLLSHLAKLHETTEFTWQTCSNYLSFTVETKGIIIVKVGSEFEVPRVLPRLLEIKDLVLTSIECTQISHYCWFNDFIGLLSGTNQRFQHLMQRKTLTSDNKEYSGPSRESLFHSVRRLSIRYQTAESEMMNRLFSAVHKAMPRLRSLSLQNCWHGHLTDCSGFGNLPLLGDRLEELEVGGDPHALFAILQLIECSITLKNVHYHQAATGNDFLLDDKYASALAGSIHSCASDIVESSSNRNKKRKGACSCLQELHINYPFQDSDAFEDKLVKALEGNKIMRVLQLPQLASFHVDEQKSAGCRSLVDLVRFQLNTTLVNIFLNDDKQNAELDYWCRRNQLLRALDHATLGRQEAVSKVLSLLGLSHQHLDISVQGLDDRFCQSLTYEMIRYQPDLWIPKVP